MCLLKKSYNLFLIPSREHNFYLSFRNFSYLGLNEKGEAVKWQASGWSARILQHEMDHLNGILYIDRMDSKTFINIQWQEHNE